jgi:fermentation-respiration switch protein FrsA (DUF1100 family)
VTLARWLALGGVIVVLAGFAAVTVLHRLQQWVVFPAPGPRGPEADLVARGAERAWLEAGGARCEAFFLPARTDAPATGAVIVFAHGNGELIDDWLDAFEAPRGWGVSVLLVEYPGYGRSTGTPSEASLTAALTKAYDWALTRPGVDPARVVGWGRSLGGGAISALARERTLAALVLESTFTSVRSMAQAFGVPAFLVRDPLDNLSVIESFPGPVLVVHGERDDMIPVAHARALAAAARSARLVVVTGCGHNDCPQPWADVRAFLDENGLLKP